MEKILAAYRRASKQWSATMNKLAQGKIRDNCHTPLSCLLLLNVYFVLICLLLCVILKLSILLPVVRQRGRKRTMVG